MLALNFKMGMNNPLYYCRQCGREMNSFTCECQSDTNFRLMWDSNMRENIQEKLRRLKLKATNSNIIIKEKDIMNAQKKYLKKDEVRKV